MTSRDIPFILPIEQEQYWIDQEARDARYKQQRKKDLKEQKKMNQPPNSKVFQQQVFYIITPEHEERPVKLGITNNPTKRLAMLQVGSWKKLIIHKFFVVGKHAAKLEEFIHLHLVSTHIRGEWFDIDAEEAEGIVREFFNNNLDLWVDS